MGKMDDAEVALNAALNGGDDDVALAMGRVKGYLRHLKNGKSVQVKGHDRHFEPGSAADYRDQAAQLRRMDSSVSATRLANRLDDAAAEIEDAPTGRDFEVSGPQVTPYVMRDTRAEARIIAAGHPDTAKLRAAAESLASKEDGTGYWGSLAEELHFIADRRADIGGPTVSDLNERAKAEGSGAKADKSTLSMSEQQDRKSLPPDLQDARIVGREPGHWVMTTASGHFVSVTWGEDGGAPNIWRYPDTEPLPSTVGKLITSTQLRLSSVDSAEEALLVELAGLIDVKSYFRRTKTGKTVNVKSYKRKVLGSALKPGDIVKDTFGKQQTVSSVTPQKVTFKSGKTGSPKASFEKVGEYQIPGAKPGDTIDETFSPSGTPNPTAIKAVQGRKSTGYDAARVARSGNKGAEGAKAPAIPASKGATVPPMTDEEYVAHTQMIETEIGKALSEGKATDKQFAVDANSGVWDFERAQRHREIADAMWKARAEQVPNEGKAMISGGLGGAGKSTVLKTVPGADEKNYFTINSDDVKEHMAENHPDMIPEVGSLSPLERVALIHEESSHIADLLAARAYAEKKNMIWDITMASEKSVQKRISDLRANGYTDVQGVFVNIDVETSVSRALARHRRGMEDFRNGKGQGGRYVPPAIIRLNKSDTSSSANLDTFTALRDQFNSWHQYNNNVTGRAPVKEGSGSGSAASSVAADPFVNKAIGYDPMAGIRARFPRSGR